MTEKYNSRGFRTGQLVEWTNPATGEKHTGMPVVAVYPSLGALLLDGPKLVRFHSDGRPLKRPGRQVTTARMSDCSLMPEVPN